MADLPTGTVTLLFTDIEHSTQLLQRLGPRYGPVLSEYRALVRAIFQEHGGHEVDTQGDSFFVAFPRAVDAVTAAVAIQRALAAHPWPEGVTLATRMGLHTGEPQRGAEGYIGLDVHRAARIGAAGHGGQVLLSEATRGIVAYDLPSGVQLRDLGPHRLKDLQDPRHLFQVMVPDLPSAFPPLATLDAYLNNLPLQLTSFIGRDTEVAAIHQRLRDPAVRLLTLTGPGGTGKTRLALQVAAELLDHFPDGVWFVNLAPISDPTLVLPTLVETLGVQPTSVHALTERLRDVLRNQHLLMVLDNFEQVLAAAPDLTPVLAAVPGLKLLVTSRAVLHLAAEHTYPVSPLALPDLQQLPDLNAVAQSEAVALFSQRARAATPAFQLTLANAPAVVEICARLDGLPLAIELAAARSRIFAPPALLARLQPTDGAPSTRRLQFLTGGARDLPTRQQTIRNTIVWSYSLLSAAEQRLFRRLAVFVGGWTVEAAEAVCDIDGDLGVEVLEGLTTLVEQSLLRQVEGSDGEPRFRRLETIREYAVEQVTASGETELLQARHAAYYLQLAETAASALYGLDQVMWLDRLDAEYPNLRAALEWSFHGGTREEGLRFGAALGSFWFLRGRFQEGDRWLTRLVADRSRATLAVQAQALARAGLMAYLVSDTTRSRMLLEEAAALSRASGDRWTYAFALLQLDQMESGLAVARDVGDAWLIAVAQVRHAYVLAGQGRWVEACAGFEAGVASFRRLGDAWGRYWALVILANQLYSRGEYAQAEAYTVEALAQATQVGHSSGIAQCQLLLGQLAYARGDDAGAAALLAESLTGYRKCGHRTYTAQVLVWLGKIALTQGDDRQALAWLDEALALCRAINDAAGSAWALQQTARVARSRGQTAQATTLLREGLALVRDTHDWWGDWPAVQFVLLDDLARLAAIQGEVERSARLFGAAKSQRILAGAVRTPADRAAYDRDVAAARAQLDADAWQIAWAEGRAMTLEQAVAYALEDAAG